MTSKTTLVQIKHVFNNPSIGQTSKSSSNSRKKRSLNRKVVVDPKIGAEKLSKRKLGKDKIADSLKNHKRKHLGLLDHRLGVTTHLFLFRFSKRHPILLAGRTKEGCQSHSKKVYCRYSICQKEFSSYYFICFYS